MSLHGRSFRGALTLALKLALPIQVGQISFAGVFQHGQLRENLLAIAQTLASFEDVVAKSWIAGVGVLNGDQLLTFTQHERASDAEAHPSQGQFVMTATRQQNLFNVTGQGGSGRQLPCKNVSFRISGLNFEEHAQLADRFLIEAVVAIHLGHAKMSLGHRFVLQDFLIGFQGLQAQAPAESCFGKSQQANVIVGRLLANGP